MKFWWIANIYWIACISYFSYKLNEYDFDTSVLGDDTSNALIAFVMICASLMVIEFQAAWYLYLKFKKRDQRHKK